jgi:hypothetical protein
MKNLKDHIGNRTRDLSACISVSELRTKSNPTPTTIFLSNSKLATTGCLKSSGILFFCGRRYGLPCPLMPLRRPSNLKSWQFAPNLESDLTRPVTTFLQLKWHTDRRAVHSDTNIYCVITRRNNSTSLQCSFQFADFSVKNKSRFFPRKTSTHPNTHWLLGGGGGAFFGGKSPSTWSPAVGFIYCMIKSLTVQDR